MANTDADEREGERGDDDAGSAPRVTPNTQNVRFATAMTGGVSLAIWMGGVARELILLEQASQIRNGLHTDDALPVVEPEPGAPGTGPSAAEIARSRYLRLLELLDVTIDVDVLSGTSAGGINAALLGFTRARGRGGRPRRAHLELSSPEPFARQGQQSAAARACDPATNKQRALTNLICVGFRQLASSSFGLHTTIDSAFARDTATLKRWRS